MVLASKICSAVLLAGLRLLAGLLPLKVYKKLDKWGRQGDENGSGKGAGRKHRIDLLLSAFLCFGAGLLLSTCFIHMIPEVIVVYFSNHLILKFLFSLVGAGFF